LRRLSNLVRLELQLNQLSGNFDFLEQSTIFPSIVNVSGNNIGPVLSRFSTLSASGPSFHAVVDTRNNVFECPYPDNFAKSVVLVISPCQQPWTKLGILSSVFVPLLLIYLLLRKCISTDKFKLGMLCVDYCLNLVGFAFDFLNIFSILKSLLVNIDMCSPFNFAAVFYYFVKVYFVDQPAPGPSTTFVDWIQSFISFNDLSANNPLVLENLESFKFLCETVPECGVDALGTMCLTIHQEKSLTGQQAFATFYTLVILLAAVRGIVELARLLLVLYLCWQGDILVLGTIGVEFVSASFALPLVFVSAESRLSATQHFISHERTPAEMIFRLFHVGMLVTLPTLAVNVFYVLKVAQTGLSLVNWVSLTSGLILVPRILAQATLSWYSQSTKNKQVLLHNQIETSAWDSE
jgi:hypothetical protein